MSIKLKETLILFFFSLIPLALCLVPDVFAYSPAGKIVGRVINRTRGEMVVSGQEIFLEKYENQTLKEKIKTLTNEQGYFEFANLYTLPQYSYTLNLNFQGATYAGHPFAFSENETVKMMNMGVFETTKSDEKIKINAKHIILDIEENVFKINEIVVLENADNKTFLGPLKFSLPQGFSELKYEKGLMSCCINEKEDGFLETMPFYPGFKEVTYSYQVKFTSSKHLFSTVADYPITGNLDFFIRDTGIKLETKQMVPVQPLQMGEKKYFRLSTKGIPAKQMITIKIAGLPVGPEAYRGLILAIVGLIILVGFIYPFLRKRKVMPEEVSQVSVPSEVSSEEMVSSPVILEEKKKELLKEIAELDDRFSEGEINEREYQKIRAQKKRNLVEICMQLK